MDLFAAAAATLRGGRHPSRTPIPMPYQPQAAALVDLPQPTPPPAPSPQLVQEAWLPSEALISEAFSKLSNFSLSGMLPPNLKDPLEKLPPDLRQEVDNVNLVLESNVQRLFGSKDARQKEEITEIQTALTALVARSDPLLTPDEKKEDREKTTSRAFMRIKKPILVFYPRLLQLMKALLAYSIEYGKNTVLEGNQPAAFTFRAWMQVQRYLQNIQSVIVYAAQEHLIDLNDFPIDFNIIIQTSEQDKLALQGKIAEQQAHIAELQGKMLEKSLKEKALNEEYQGIPEQITQLMQQLQACRGVV